MPKMKRHSGMKKRIKITGSGKLRREQTNKRHLLEGKNSRRLRKLSRDENVAKSDRKQVKRLLGLR